MNTGKFLLALGAGASVLFVGLGGIFASVEEANKALCLSRMKDLAVAIRHYAEDHKGELPLAADRSRRPWGWWYEAIFPYATSVESFYCPQLIEDKGVILQRSRLLPTTWNVHLLSYGMAYPIDAYQRKHGRLLWSGVQEPREKILLGESHAPILRNTEQYWAEDVAPRHAGCANFVTFDGEGFCAGDLPGAAPTASGSGIHNLANWNLP